MNWGAVVAAGGLVGPDLAEAIGTRRKALAPIGGRTCLDRTLGAVKGSGIGACVTVSGEDVRSHVTFGAFVHEADRQIENARRAAAELKDADAILFLPADSPLLTPEILSEFVTAVEVRVEPRQERWLAAGLCSLEQFQASFPEIATRPLALKDGRFLSGALYAASPVAFRHALAEIERMSQSRKSQLGMAVRLGPWTVLKFLFRRVTLAEAELTLGGLFGAQAIIVTGCDPRMAVDIDDAHDYRAVQDAFARGADA